MDRFYNTDRNSAIYMPKKGRIKIVTFCFVLFFMIVSARLIQSMLLSEAPELDYHAPKIEADQTRLRANIYDRNGELLATSVKMASAYLNPQDVIDPEETIEKIHGVLPDLSKDKLRQWVTSDKKFIWLKRNITPYEQQRLHCLGLPELNFMTEQKRLYPKGNLFSHVLGVTDIDGKGMSGVERSFEQLLSVEGQEITLSIDARVQHIVSQELERGILDFNAIGGAAILMDAKTGEVIASVSKPDFDPHDLALYNKEMMFNRITQAIYEPGSTMKIFNTAFALDSGRVRVTDLFDATRPLQVARFQIKDFQGKNKVMSVPEVFMYSSNIGSALIGQKMGPSVQKDYLKKIGMLDVSPVEILEKEKPMSPHQWRDINAMTIAYGYGVAVTPVHLATGVSTVVNGGYKIKPTLLKSDRDQSDESQRVLKPETSRMLRDLMRLGVKSGTSKGAYAEGYDVGGKTGTALKTRSGKGYNQTSRRSAFAGAFPMSDPRYVLYIMVDEPKPNAQTYGYATGGWVAAPIASRIIKQIGPALDLLPVYHQEPEIERIAPYANGLYQNAAYLIR